MPTLSVVPDLAASDATTAAAGMSTASFEAGFSQVFSQRFAPLFRYLARLTGDKDLASDLAQDAFVRLYRRGELPLGVGAWLVTVAHNQLRDQQRSVRRRLRLLVTGRERVPTPTPAVEPHVEVLAAEQRQRVRAVLTRLTERDQQILLLHHSDFSYREISVVLDIVESGVGTTLRRAEAAFRQAFEETYGAPD